MEIKMKNRWSMRMTALACVAQTALVVGCGGGGDGGGQVGVMSPPAGGGNANPPPATQPISLQEKCGTLAGAALDATTMITSASVVSGSFTPPGGTAPVTGVPESCRLVGVAKPVPGSNINFEVWLPTSNWNQKFLSAFEGGLAGYINYPSVLQSLARGYATAGTDIGHVDPAGGTGGDWIVDHPERVTDFGHRGKHIQTVAAKAAIQLFYGAPPAKSYFAGCSGGGREGLMELQRYPDDYDGYVIGAPANNWTGQTTRWAWDNQALANPASQIPSAKLPALKAATLAQCDAVDGVTDGIITNPRACTFNPDVLECAAGTDTNACFTAPQVTALKKIYQGPRDSASRQLFPGSEIGAEDDANPAPSNWDFFITGPIIRMTLGFWTYGRMLHNLTDWDPLNFNFDTDSALMQSVLGPKINATNSDLRIQKAKGIKIIHYHGWADAALSPQESINYYQSVVAQAGGIDKAQEFYKLYMVPGMVHCGGGPGPNVFGPFGNAGDTYIPNGTAKNDMIKALEDWVEKGQAPDTITATKYINDDIRSPVVMKRPLCPWPKVQKYVSGDPNIESSFVCSAS